MNDIWQFPKAFPNKGRFRVYSSSWEPQGWADEPQYPGQQPLNFPEDAKPIECFFGGYLSPRKQIGEKE